MRDLIKDPIIKYFIFFNVFIFIFYFYKKFKKYFGKSKQPSNLYAYKQQSIETSPGIRNCVLNENTDLVKQYFKDVTTVADAFMKGYKKYGNKPLFGEIQTDTCTWITYKEAFSLCQRLGSALLLKGLLVSDVSSLVAIYSGNCVEWNIVAETCSMFSMVFVPIYNTFSFDIVKNIVINIKIKVFVCETWTNALHLLERLSKGTPLKLVVILKDSDCMNPYKRDSRFNIQKNLQNNLTVSNQIFILASEFGIEVRSYKEMLNKGLKNMKALNPPAPTFPHSIMFTQGSTGPPKPVLMTHSAMIANVSGNFFNDYDKNILPKEDDTHYSHLPSAYAPERSIQIIMMMVGGRIAFGNTDANFFKNLSIVKPSFLITVPYVIRSICQKAIENMSKNCLNRRIRKYAVGKKIKLLKRGVITKNTWWDSMIFRSVQQLLGGELRVCISTSSCLPQKYLDFVKASFGCYFYEAYSLTELGGIVAISMFYETKHNTVGGPLPHCTFKLSPKPEIELLALEDLGEVTIFSTSRMTEYVKNVKLTKEGFDRDSFFHTGDVGKWNSNGSLTYVERFEHLFECPEGFLISPEYVENVYLTSPFIHQIYVEFNGVYLHQDNPIAIIVPCMDYAKLFLFKNQEQYNLDTETLENLNKLILDDMKIREIKSNLKRFERVDKIILNMEAFKVEDGLLTPTMNNNRRNIHKKFKSEFKSLTFLSSMNIRSKF